MKIIILTGPTGSGKTTLATKIQEKVTNGIILSTDDYYKTGLISRLLSKVLNSYYDRKISFNYKLLRKDLDFILKNNEINHKYSYNFTRKKITKSFKHKKNIRFLIVEGIFGQELINNLKAKDSLFIELTTNKLTCMKRVIKRDVKERGKSKKLAKSDFLNSWGLFYKKNNEKIRKNFIKLDFSKNRNLEQIVNKVVNYNA